MLRNQFAAIERTSELRQYNVENIDYFQALNPKVRNILNDFISITREKNINIKTTKRSGFIDITEMMLEGHIIKKYFLEKIPELTIKEKVEMLCKVFNLGEHYIRRRLAIGNASSNVINAYLSAAITFFDVMNLIWFPKDLQNEVLSILLTERPPVNRESMVKFFTRFTNPRRVKNGGGQKRRTRPDVTRKIINEFKQTDKKIISQVHPNSGLDLTQNFEINKEPEKLKQASSTNVFPYLRRYSGTIDSSNQSLEFVVPEDNPNGHKLDSDINMIKESKEVLDEDSHSLAAWKKRNGY